MLVVAAVMSVNQVPWRRLAVTMGCAMATAAVSLLWGLVAVTSYLRRMTVAVSYGFYVCALSVNLCAMSVGPAAVSLL